MLVVLVVLVVVVLVVVVLVVVVLMVLVVLVVFVVVVVVVAVVVVAKTERAEGVVLHGELVAFLKRYINVGSHACLPLFEANLHPMTVSSHDDATTILRIQISLRDLYAILNTKRSSRLHHHGLTKRGYANKVSRLRRHRSSIPSIQTPLP